jgi:prepilin-type processing-associated H-X9-DG protein
MASLIYADDNQDYIVQIYNDNGQGGRSWDYLLFDYYLQTTLIICPSNRRNVNQTCRAKITDYDWTNAYWDNYKRGYGMVVTPGDKNHWRWTSSPSTKGVRFASCNDNGSLYGGCYTKRTRSLPGPSVTAMFIDQHHSSNKFRRSSYCEAVQPTGMSGEYEVDMYSGGNATWQLGPHSGRVYNISFFDGHVEGKRVQDTYGSGTASDAYGIWDMATEP